MAHGITSIFSMPRRTSGRQPVASYDSGYEHSLDHYLDVKVLVQDADLEADGTSQAEGLH